MTKGFIQPEKPNENELKEINKFTKRSLTADEVYAFSVVLCDNDIDRDFERFTPEALKKLSKLFLGKTGIFDHSMKSGNQIARIYSTAVEKTAEKTSDGQPYVMLKAKAYIPITDQTKEFIQRLEAGILKEVSVGCSVGRQICSVCGADRRHGLCEHKKGKFYGEGLKKMQCYTPLEDPIDAYEWSFVAVPAQRKAGVIKAYKTQEGEKDMTAEEIVKSMGDDEVTLSKAQANVLKNGFEALLKDRHSLRDDLKRETVKCCAGVLPELSGDTLNGILDALSVDQMKAFKSALKSKNTESVQLNCGSDKNIPDNKDFLI